MATLTSNDIVNRAIALISDDQAPVQGQYPNFDSTPAGQACNQLYNGVIQTLLRKGDPDFARATVALGLTGNAAPVGWAFEYTYPANGIQIRQLLPTAIVDPNDPLPINWVVGNATVAGTPTKVIWTNQQTAKVTYTAQPPEGLWDSLFVEEAVRLLASELAMALAGRPDTAQNTFESAMGFGQIAQGRDS